MEKLVSEKIEHYCTAHTTLAGPLFYELAEATREKTERPQMQVGPLEGGFLRFLVGLVGARRVLEIGTFTGYSALMMAEGLPENGELITLDVDPKATAIAREFWSRSPHGKKIQLKLGDATAALRELAGPFDLVFIDADKESYARYWDLCVPMVRSGGLIVVDNVLWSGRVLKPQDETDRAIVAFNTHAAQDRRVEAVMLSVRDGMTLARKL